MKKEYKLVVLVRMDFDDEKCLPYALKHSDGFTSFIVKNPDHTIHIFLDRQLTQRVDADNLFNLMVKLNHLGYVLSNPFKYQWETLK